ncbi:MAG: hypothetical protein AB7Q17_18205 [Phycisphaerae bacterium]
MTLITDRLVLVAVPDVLRTHLLASGVASLDLGALGTAALNPAEPPQPWVSIADAARQLLDDVDGLTIDAARMRVRAAIDAENPPLVARGSGRDTRIEPRSLAAWRLGQRERDLDLEPRRTRGFGD